MKAVILAGGFGSRLSEETDDKPKPMVEIGGRPILWHIMKIYGHFGITEFVICLGYKGYVIKEYFANYALHNADVTIDLASGRTDVLRRSAEPWKVTLVDTGPATMTGGRLKRVREHVGDGAFCMTYGDGVADIDIRALVDFHRKHGKKATVTAVSPPGRFGAMDMEGDAVTAFHEKPQDAGAWINGGFFVLEPSALDEVADDRTVWESGPLVSLSRAGELRAYRHRGFWHCMDTLRDRRQLDALWESGDAPWRVWE